MYCQFFIEQRRLREDEYPLITRILLGPHEDVARIFIVDRHSTYEVSNEVAQFLNLSVTECSAILEGYQKEEERQLHAIRDRYIFSLDIFFIISVVSCLTVTLFFLPGIWNFVKGSNKEWRS